MRKKRCLGWWGGNEGSFFFVDFFGVLCNVEVYGVLVVVFEVLGVSGIGSWGDNGYVVCQELLNSLFGQVLLQGVKKFL